MIYRRTSTQIIAEIIDDTAKSDSTITASAQSFSTPSNLTNDNVRTYDYMTNELNYSLLDGALSEISTPNNFAYVSSYISGSDMTFSTNPTITITFTSGHTSAGITINFDGHYIPETVNVKYYDSLSVGASPIADDTFTVSSPDFFCNHNSLIEGYKKILITFTKTKYPYSFVKVINIDYGVKYNWGIDEDTDILNAHIVEETDSISNNLAMDTLEFTVYDEREDFNMLSLDGLYTIVQQYQKVKVYETIEKYDGTELIDSTTLFMGNFYIKDWISNAEHEITFRCVDLIGVMESVEFNMGAYYIPNVDTVSTVINSIMSCAGIKQSQYNITNNIKNLKIEGFLPLMSCRQALQQVVFCIGAVADCARDEKINIYLPSSSIQHIIEDENNLEFEQIQKNDMISDVVVSQFFLGAGSTGVEIFKGRLPVGDHKISSSSLIYAEPDPDHPSEYASPKVVVGDQSARIIDAGLSYFVIRVTTTDYFEVTSTTWGVQKFSSMSVHNPSAKVKKEIKCENNYLLTDRLNPTLNYATDAANRLLNYYSRPNTMETEFILTNEKTGNWCVLNNKYGNQTKGNIIRMDIDLTGGFLAKAKLIGVEDISSLEYNYVCGSELYAGETNNDNIGLI